MIKRFIVAALIAGLLPLAVAQANGTMQAQYEKAYKQAQTLHEKVVAIDYQWKPAVDALDAAQKAADAGNYEKAIAKLERVVTLDKLAMKQASQQDEVWQSRVVQ